MEFSHDLRVVQGFLKQPKKFWLDTNVFVNLAKEGHRGHEVLETLANAHFNFVFYKENHDELSGVLKKKEVQKEIGSAGIHALEKFLRAVSVAKDTPESYLVEHRRVITSLLCLVPRQIVYDVFLSTDDSSFVSRVLFYLDLYEKKPQAALDDLKQIQADMASVQDTARRMALDRADELIDKIDLDRDTLAAGGYFDSLEKMASNTLKKLKQIFAEHANNLSVARQLVDEEREKNQCNDGKFVIRLIHDAIECRHSNDNDVHMLLLLHITYRKIVAGAA